MAKPKLTEWFSGIVKPVHVGVYQRDYGGHGHPNHVFYGYWDGKYWGSGELSPDTASANKCGVSRAPWRGLAEQPKEQKK